MVSANKDRPGPELAQLSQQLLPVRQVGKVRLVVPKEAPDWPKRSFRLSGVDLDRDRKRGRGVWLCVELMNGQESGGTEREKKPKLFHDITLVELDIQKSPSFEAGANKSE
jgi:hypothetical protein